MQKVLAKNCFLGYTLGMEKQMQDRQELQEFLVKFNELRRQFPNVEFDSESGFEAVEVYVGNQVEYVSRECEK